jgi:hypothetical protein
LKVNRRKAKLSKPRKEHSVEGVPSENLVTTRADLHGSTSMHANNRKTRVQYCVECWYGGHFGVKCRSVGTYLSMCPRSSNSCSQSDGTFADTYRTGWGRAQNSLRSFDQPSTTPSERAIKYSPK